MVFSAISSVGVVWGRYMLPSSVVLLTLKVCL